MPWRLIVFIVIFAIFLVFITFNLDNRCDLNLVFKTFHAVPVFITIFTSFFLGLVCSLPFILFKKRKKVEKPKKDKIEELDEASPRNQEDNLADRRERFRQEHGGNEKK